MPIKMRRGGSWRSSSASRRKRRVTLAPPMCLHLRHSFEGIILGFASGRKRLWRSTIRLRAITDRPEVSVLSLRVRLDPERERRSLIGHDWQYGAWQFSAKIYRHRDGHLLASAVFLTPGCSPLVNSMRAATVPGDVANFSVEGWKMPGANRRHPISPGPDGPVTAQQPNR
jgi:hypothetical protein